MKQLYYFLTILVCVALIASCKKEEKPLGVKGLWNEKISAVYDTLNHNKISSLDLDCDGVFSFVKTTCYRHYQNPGDIQTDSILDSTVNNGAYVMRSYDEYIKGRYSIESDKIYFSGSYYVDSTSPIVADSTNTQHNYGSYIDTVAFVIDSKCLMLNLDAHERQDIRRFEQQKSYECTW
jgi:hypothetical protein